MAIVTSNGITSKWADKFNAETHLTDVVVTPGKAGCYQITFSKHGQIPDAAAQYAAFTEEPAKLLVTALFIYFINPRYIFNRLLIGAAVGAFESLDYVVHSGENYMNKLICRSVNIFGTHLMWAAIEGGAPVMVKGKENLSLSHFTDARFLPYLAISMTLHFVGNYDFYLMRVLFFADMKYILMCCVALYVAGILINKAIVQVLNEGDVTRRPTDTTKDSENSQTPPNPKAILRALSGPLKGKGFPFKDKITVGRNFKVCNVIFPPKTPGVSKKHCELEYSDLTVNENYFFLLGTEFLKKF